MKQRKTCAHQFLLVYEQSATILWTSGTKDKETAMPDNQSGQYWKADLLRDSSIFDQLWLPIHNFYMKFSYLHSVTPIANKGC